MLRTIVRSIGFGIIGVGVLLAIASTAGDNTDARALAGIMLFPAAALGIVGGGVVALTFWRSK